MRKLALIVSVSLGIAAEPVFALGLGEIELHSALNEPLRAEIPLFAVRSGQRDLITARIADTEAFTRAGVERYPILSDIRFTVIAGATPDQAVLQLRTATPVREPFLSMLLEVTWPEGRLIREYTALLDPPGSVSPRTNRPRPADSGEFATRPYESTREPPARSADRGAHEYGPVREDETLWSIAYAQRPSDSITMDQMMLAIYEANPEAFDGSINRIRAGSMLRIPSAEAIRATDSSQARREVGRQRRGTEPSDSARGERVEVTPPPVAPPPAEAAPASPPKPKGELRLSTPEGSAPSAGPVPGETQAPPPPAQPPAEEAPAVPPPATAEVAPDAAVSPPDPAATPARSAAPIEIRDNSAKALELLAVHAREHGTRQPGSESSGVEATPPPAEPATPPVAEAPPVVTAPAPVAEPPPASTTPPATAESPFADQPTDATPSSPATPVPSGTPAEVAPPASPPAAAPPPAAPPPAAVETTSALDALDPLLLGLGAAAVLLIGIAAVKLRQRRARRPVTLAPIVLSEVEPGANSFGDMLEEPARKPASRIGDTLQQTSPPAARTAEATLQSTMPPERTTQQFMAVSTPQPQPPPPAPAAAETALPGGVDPYADALSEVDIHIAYGLYDEAARILQEPLAKSPERKDLHLKLLEVYFSANLPSEFEAQARTMRGIVASDSDPDWQKACIMGQQLCPGLPLFAAGAAAGGGAGATADMDFQSLLGSAQPTSPASAPTAASAPSLDFAGLDLGLDKAATVKPPPKPSAPPPAPPAPAAAPESNTLDFNLDEFKLDVPAAVSSPPPAADDDGGLDIDLSDFDVGAPAATSPAPAAASSAAAAGEMDDLLTADIGGGGAEQADTRLDLARAYMDMGEPAMAQSLLQEVIAQGNPNQKQEAQELLKRLDAG